MTEEATVARIALHAPRSRAALLRSELARRANWAQLVRFALVGASGYVVNLVVFWAVLRASGISELAAVAAFLVAVSNNFHWNRHWTFAATDGSTRRQAARFLAVSVIAFGVNLALLELLARVAGLPDVPAQALAVLSATPASFLANKLWSFRA